jgi:hypothetical protein
MKLNVSTPEKSAGVPMPMIETNRPEACPAA